MSNRPYNNKQEPSQELAPLTPDSKPGKLAKVLGMPLEYVELVRDVVAKGATPEEFCLFLQIVNDTGLNPLNKEIYFYKTWDSLAGRELPIIHASIQGRRKAAERIGGYCPGKETQFNYDSSGNLISATAYVKRKIDGDWQEISFTAFWDEFAKYKSDGKTPSNKWATMGRHMLSKCAETHALNRAFPQLESLADTDNLPTAAFAAAFSPESPTPPTPEEDHKRKVLTDNLGSMAEILLDEKQCTTLMQWAQTATIDALVERHNRALAQFMQYASGVYQAIPEGERAAALAEFNVEAYEAMDLEMLFRFVLTFQKEEAKQDHPSNVPTAHHAGTSPEDGRPNNRGRADSETSK